MAAILFRLNVLRITSCNFLRETVFHTGDTGSRSCEVVNLRCLLKSSPKKAIFALFNYIHCLRLPPYRQEDFLEYADPT